MSALASTDRGTTAVPRASGGLRRTPLSYTVLGLVAAYSLVPVLMLVFNSLKSDLELGRNPLGPPQNPRLENFTEAWVQGSLGRGMLNSAIIVLGTVVGVWICAGLAAYALARLDVPFKGGIATYLFLVISLPVQIFLVPLFFLWSRLGLTDTLQGLIIIYVAINTPFATLLLRSFLVAIPKEIDEAARIDGANELQTAVRVVLPLARPGFLTVGIVVGLAAYNELLFAVTFISEPSTLPIATAYLNFSQGFTQQYGLLNAAGVIMVVPVLVMFVLMQKKFISGLAAGGVKG
ncbi:MAG: carbohydrate ABC transporter permease [Actinomycetales bacterium]|nr:carbohydrate ABC transporter permease [Actinomycetales bacterium]